MLHRIKRRTETKIDIVVAVVRTETGRGKKIRKGKIRMENIRMIKRDGLTKRKRAKPVRHHQAKITKAVQAGKHFC